MTALYRHFDRWDTLLYVGISSDITYRIYQHEREASWANLITRIDVEHFDTREQALAAEAVAIRQEQPVYNIRGRASGRSGRGAWAIYEPSTGLADGWYFKYADAWGMRSFYGEEHPDVEYVLVARGSPLEAVCKRVLATTAPLIMRGPTFRDSYLVAGRAEDCTPNALCTSDALPCSESVIPLHFLHCGSMYPQWKCIRTDVQVKSVSKTAQLERLP